MTKLAFVMDAGIKGVHRSGVYALTSLAASGFDVAVVTSRRFELGSRCQEWGRSKPKWCILPSRTPLSSKLTVRLPLQFAAWVAKMAQNSSRRRRLKNLRPDVLFVNDWVSDPLLVASTVSASRATVLILHFSPKLFSLRSQSLAPVLAGMDRYSHFIFVSRRARDDWDALGALKDKPAYYIPNCCDEDSVMRLTSHNRALLRRELGFAEGRFIAVCVGAIGKAYLKGEDVIVDLLPHLVNAVPDLMLYMMGFVTDPQQANNLEERVKVGGFADSVQFLGYKDNALDYIYAADVLLLPSRSEGMPLVVLEAMALKTPVIASDVGGIPELVEDGVTGLLFSHSNPMGLVVALKRMADNVSERLIFVERASDKYWSDFSAAKQEERYTAVVEDIMSCSKP